MNYWEGFPDCRALFPGGSDRKARSEHGLGAGQPVECLFVVGYRGSSPGTSGIGMDKFGKLFHYVQNKITGTYTPISTLEPHDIIAER
uniref:Peptidase S1 domain-containing protein n=1 Tax=Caenorhabditis tropicalis TaxID=1561998 RepID=A0A1I7U4A2_9PELO